MGNKLSSNKNATSVNKEETHSSSQETNVDYKNILEASKTLTDSIDFDKVLQYDEQVKTFLENVYYDSTERNCIESLSGVGQIFQQMLDNWKKIKERCRQVKMLPLILTGMPSNIMYFFSTHVLHR